MTDNIEIASRLKTVLRLRSEPVAIKLVKKGEEYPEGYELPKEQRSHCQAVMDARNGSSYKMTAEMQGCNVGAATLGMMPKPEKVRSGEFHAGIGIHENVASAKEMNDSVIDVPYETVGEIVCPLKDANFTPDVVVVVDIPERVYWFEAFYLYSGKGRITYTTAPFQCACEDVTAVPVVTGKPNISIGCFGCRRRTSMKADEMAIGVPFSLIPDMMKVLDKYENTVLVKAKRD